MHCNIDTGSGSTLISHSVYTLPHWRSAHRRYESDNERSPGQVPTTTSRRWEIWHEMSSTEQQRDDVTDWLQRLTDVTARTTRRSGVAWPVLQQIAKHRSSLYYALVHFDSRFESNRFDSIHLTNLFESIRFPKKQTVRFDHNLLESVCEVSQLRLSVLSMLASYT